MGSRVSGKGAGRVTARTGCVSSGCGLQGRYCANARERLPMPSVFGYSLDARRHFSRLVTLLHLPPDAANLLRGITPEGNEDGTSFVHEDSVRGFAFHLVITTLRRLGQIDDIIDRCLDNKLPPKARFARTILRLGICQLLFLETPPHAAVSTSVDLLSTTRMVKHDMETHVT